MIIGENSAFKEFGTFKQRGLSKIENKKNPVWCSFLCVDTWSVLQCNGDIRPTEILWDVAEQKTHTLDVQPRNVQQLCDAIVNQHLCGTFPAPLQSLSWRSVQHWKPTKWGPVLTHSLWISYSVLQMDVRRHKWSVTSLRLAVASKPWFIGTRKFKVCQKLLPDAITTTSWECWHNSGWIHGSMLFTPDSTRL